MVPRVTAATEMLDVDGVPALRVLSAFLTRSSLSAAPRDLESDIGQWALAFRLQIYETRNSASDVPLLHVGDRIGGHLWKVLRVRGINLIAGRTRLTGTPAGEGPAAC